MPQTWFDAGGPSRSAGSQLDTRQLETMGEISREKSGGMGEGESRCSDICGQPPAPLHFTLPVTRIPAG